MNKETGQGLNQPFMVVVGILGAATFVALVLVMQNPTYFEVEQIGLFTTLSGIAEFHAITVYLGAVCIFSAFSVLALSIVGAGLARPDSMLGWFGYALGGTTVVGFAVAVWVLVSQEADPESDSILGVIVILAVIFFVALLRGVRPPKGPPGR